LIKRGIYAILLSMMIRILSKQQTFGSLLTTLAEFLLPAYDLPQGISVAGWLIEMITERSKTQLMSMEQLILTQQHYEQLARWVDDLVLEHKPLAYIIGWVPFADLKIAVEPPILIPRLETEEWVMDLISILKRVSERELTILDLCTGSGVIGLSLAAHLCNAHITALDTNEQALKLAEKNKKNLHLSRIQFLLSDLYEGVPLKSRFDVIVANPPYIDENEWVHLEPSVRNWEDPHALIAEDNGVAILEKIINQAPYYLQESFGINYPDMSNLFVEIGAGQGKSVAELCWKAGAEQVIIHQDAAGHDRWISARMLTRRMSEAQKTKKSYYAGCAGSFSKSGGSN